MVTDGRSAPVFSKVVRMTRARRTALLKALADPKRFELLERVARASCPLGCMEARAALKIAPATLSHHVKELEAAGLIDVRREGKFVFLALRPGVLESLTVTLQSLAPAQCADLPVSKARPGRPARDAAGTGAKAPKSIRQDHWPG